ncbi:DUF2726 domain-containing protein [Micromonospora sp. NBC_01813]|uniref:DUF2726 domain-containing protein n=1 Tax=Micromonospora sp. NBC_01813 TaxID=2975988 RepID=UPI002DDB4640|nr:DUF2726 domain-containing protein [Micromonospora sp. NBC_01813]WSA11200.1 DUF2726 domain-containing protein [Micromonospora sp. NBC_01813]
MLTNDDGTRQTWLRPVLSSTEHAAGRQRGELFERAGWVIQPDRRLGQVLAGRPPGVTTRQWSVATRSRLDFVVCGVADYHPAFVVVFVDPAARSPQQLRDERMTDAVCEAVGLELLRIESGALSTASSGRRVVEYLLDARTFQQIGGGDSAPETAGSVSYRDIIGRLPDGRTGYVNDLGAVARTRAVEAFVSRQLTDPLLRSLHVRWKDGSAEGWAWLAVRDGQFLFERVRIWPHRLECGIAPERFAEDLAAAGVGEWLKTLEVDEPQLRQRRDLNDELGVLRSRRAEMSGVFAFDHVSFS